MDFLKLKVEAVKKDHYVVKPQFKTYGFKDLMVKGGKFYAVWDEENLIWSKDQNRLYELIDNDINARLEEEKAKRPEAIVTAQTVDSWGDSKVLASLNQFLDSVPDKYVPLDSKIIFADEPRNRESYCSRTLPYSLTDGDTSDYDHAMDIWYDEENRKKIEWGIGAMLTGDYIDIQKFMYIYGPGGTAKSTVLNIVEYLIPGYFKTFNVKSLGAANDSFSTGQLADNPVALMDHDGDLSKLENNTTINLITAHEYVNINEKFKSVYSQKINSMMWIASNSPVNITDAKSGIIRRVIDIMPTGGTIPNREYRAIMRQIQHNPGPIAKHCIDIYKSMGPNAYDDYRPLSMLLKTNELYNFVSDSYPTWIDSDQTTLTEAYRLYKVYEENQGITRYLKKMVFRDELSEYFRETIRDARGVVYKGFRYEKFIKSKEPGKAEFKSSWIFSEQRSLLDDACADCPAQYARSDKPAPQNSWDKVKSTLKELDTTKLHYVRPPENLIVIDFDIPDENGCKSLEENLKAIESWPKTYAELSKSGEGIHLHYIYDGDVTKLSCRYNEKIEVKVFTGKSSLRRKLSKCNDIPIAHISSGLPLKEEKKKVLNEEAAKTEKGLRTLIKKNLNKEIHPGTKPSVDFIFKILNDAYESGLKYDVTDTRQAVMLFAMNSTNHAADCIKLVNKMKFKSEEPSENSDADGPIIFFDVEVFPNLFLINWKQRGPEHKVVRMVNPTPAEVEELMGHKLVGFNCRRYDNHILYARSMGYTNQQLYELSSKLVSKDNKVGNDFPGFSEAYNISYTDIYDFSSKKQSLKKFEIELGLHHQELGMDWNQPVPEEKWEEVAAYCDNDVISTEAVFEARQEDFMAREILASISGLTVNDTTNTHTTRIIFGKERHPDLVYTDLTEMFPGYSFDNGVSTYQGEEVGEGGYVYSEPGMYHNVALLDIASMHPSSIRALNLFGSYTKNFTDILDARIAIKHHDFDLAKTYLNGAFAPYLTDNESADKLAQALKIVINSVYGLTAVKTFKTPFSDPRNKDNIVAKRGALFMINLKHEVQKRGYTVAHIKTDSIKIPDADQEIIDFVMEYGKKYGYNFEHEATYEKMCLVNDAVYIAKVKEGKHAGEWSATGAQFAVPYVYKTLFTHEPITFEDKCETKEVSTALYLDFDGNPENYTFVGKVGNFCPIRPECGGGTLLRKGKNDTWAAPSGTKGYYWKEAEVVKVTNKEDDIDISYFQALVDKAKDTISQYGDFEWFVSDNN